MLDQGDHGNASWKQLNDYLVSRGLLTVLTQAASTGMERDIMYDATMSANQKAIFDQILQRKSLNNNMHWIMGSAETGKSFLLTQFAQHYKQMGYKIIRLAPTVVTAYNIQGKTIDCFFGTSNNIQHANTRNSTTK